MVSRMRYEEEVGDRVHAWHYQPLKYLDTQLFEEAVMDAGWWADGECDVPLIPMHCMNPIAIGYTRVVVGDYGAFIECTPDQMILGNIAVQEGQEYRIDDPKYKHNVKYHWYRPVEVYADTPITKIYYQRRTVDYADYKIGMYYLPIYEVWANRMHPEFMRDPYWREKLEEEE